MLEQNLDPHHKTRGGGFFVVVVLDEGKVEDSLL